MSRELITNSLAIGGRRRVKFLRLAQILSLFVIASCDRIGLGQVSSE